MIYTASYFCPKHHHGDRISISRSAPAQFRDLDRLDLFVPSAALLAQWKREEDEAKYIDVFREEFRSKLPQILAWVEALEPERDMTLLCWERPEQFCHRNLVGKAIAHYRPDCWGGADTNLREKV